MNVFGETPEAGAGCTLFKFILRDMLLDLRYVGASRVGVISMQSARAVVR